jgi:hypothetical protein
MKRALIAGGTLAALLVFWAIAAGYRARERRVEPAAVPPAATTPPTAPPTTPPAIASTPPSTTSPSEAENRPGFLYGRITTDRGETYEGRLRWGGDEEAFWSDYFNGEKSENTWAALVPPERLPRERQRIEILGLEIAHRQRPIDLDRLFMARFGDIARIEAVDRDVRVTLKSGTLFVLDLFEAGDFDDGVRVWDAQRGVVDLGSREIHAIELLPTPPLVDTPGRLHGTLRTRQGEFTGFVQWNRKECVGSDELEGRGAKGVQSLRFDTIRSIARRPDDSSLVTLLDGQEIVLSGIHEVGDGNRRGIYVDDRRYGRVLISWDAFERLDFSAGGTGPAYGDFPPGRPLTGSVTTRSGSRLAGRLVYDLDESETTETLDAPFEGVDYTLPFGLIASIALPGGEEGVATHATVTLHDGEKLELEREGDLGGGNAGLLIFVDGRESPEYVPWTDVERIDLDPALAIPPPLAGD